ncbi:Crp/Fnr family transcriptional regulator [Sphingomonas aliaeris]|uniref:Crp/Fnr family transcriptional regulator n=1 Tax=Sphingomonas aliaeris TaxID=2759526 RepID=UPI001CEE03EE|nr:Crp/Fnr family transcriptional regulator [Sphingomonas aliaeris]
MLEPLVRKLDLRNRLLTVDKDAILGLPSVVKSIRRNDFVVKEGEKVSQACFLMSGFAMRNRLVVNGRRQILAIHMKGDLVDLQNSFLGVADHSVQTLTDCEVAVIPAAAIKKLAFDFPRVGLALWIDTLIDGAIFREWIVNVGRRDAVTRIAHLLCELSVRLELAGLGEALRYELPLSQEQIGDATGLTSVHVNRMLKELVAEALISRNGSRSLVIDDWQRLAKRAEFDRNYLDLRTRANA